MGGCSVHDIGGQGGTIIYHKEVTDLFSYCY